MYIGEKVNIVKLSILFKKIFGAVPIWWGKP